MKIILNVVFFQCNVINEIAAKTPFFSSRGIRVTLLFVLLTRSDAKPRRGDSEALFRPVAVGLKTKNRTHLFTSMILRRTYNSWKAYMSVRHPSSLIIRDMRRSSVELQGGEEPLEGVRAIAAAGNLALFPAAFLRRRHSLGAGLVSQRLGRRLERVSSRGLRSRSIGEGSENPMEAFRGDRVEGKRFRGEAQGAFSAEDLMKSEVWLEERLLYVYAMRDK